MKTRVLPRDLGEANDLLYENYSSTYSFGTNYTAFMAYVNAMVSRYYTGMANRSIPVTFNTFSGVETFDSSGLKKPQFNNCMHVIDEIVNHAYAYMTPNASLYSWFVPRWANGFLQNYGRAGYTAYVGPSKYGASADFSQWDATARRAWWAMQPRFEGEISMLNFLFELKDFKDIAKFAMKVDWRTFSKSVRNFRLGLRNWRRNVDKSSYPVLSMMLGTASKGSKAAAKLHLTNEFAIKPFIGDIKKIVSQAGSIVSEVQEQFQSKGLVPQTQHFSESVVSKDTLVPGSNNYMFWANGERIETLFTATLEYKYSYTMRSTDSAIMKYWGLDLTPEVIWEAIPFSFLVDYFVKVGDAIHYASLDKNVSLLEYQYCESLLTKGQEGYWWRNLPDSYAVIDGQMSLGPALVAGRNFSSYVRRVVQPNKGLPTPKFKLPSGKQGINMAALARCFIK